MMVQSNSRLERDLMEWKQRELRYQKLFGDKIVETKKLLQEKLAHYEVMEIRYNTTPNLWEQMDLRFIRDERRKIERQLYPNFLSRFLYRAVKKLLDNPAVSRYQRTNQANESKLKEFLEKKGLGIATKQLDKQLVNGQEKFAIPVSYQVSESERMEFKLQFSREHTGSYAVSEIKATLVNDNDPQHKGTISLMDNGLDQVTAHQSYNLLHGRSVEQGGGWVSLDFNDKDADGNFRTRIYPSGYGFDIEKSLAEIPGMDKLSPIQKEDIMNDLRNGDKLVVDTEGKKIEVEANAQKKSIVPSPGFDTRKATKSPKVLPFEQRKQEQVVKNRMKLS